ncbi:hypothetical protein FB45DRAFT_1053724 [Roridomyces roridus]|uniref:F-box domain-containing protein n=1 Tax=Roridomyces roridus TaxID=1738132 RepID=A0AAD7C772_9AGAR|nr:hypothetical protein FB45DRAFT_1053724 [Roridomyces roridus]
MTHLDSKAVLAADRAHIAALDAQIDELEERIRHLRIERDGTQRRLDAYKYPVLTLPNETVSEIFIHTLPPYPLCPPRLPGRASPIPLTHVCRRWRDIALSTPQLWRAIGFTDSRVQLEQTEVVRTWLNRSGSCPLSIRIESQHDFALVEGWEGIALCRERWEHLVIAVTGSMLSFFLKGSMPTLSSLSVENQSLITPDVTSLDFPRLRTVSLTWFQYPVHWLPWVQVTSLTLESMISRHCIPVLRDAIHLEDLTLDNCAFSGIVNEADIPLTRLRSLVATWHVVDILKLFNVPALQTLQLWGVELGSDPIGTLASLTSRSGFKLQTLRICGAINCQCQRNNLSARSPRSRRSFSIADFKGFRGKTRRIRVIQILPSDGFLCCLLFHAG